MHIKGFRFILDHGQVFLRHIHAQVRLDLDNFSLLFLLLWHLNWQLRVDLRDFFQDLIDRESLIDVLLNHMGNQLLKLRAVIFTWDEFELMLFVFNSFYPLAYVLFGLLKENALLGNRRFHIHASLKHDTAERPDIGLVESRVVFCKVICTKALRRQILVRS